MNASKFLKSYTASLAFYGATSLGAVALMSATAHADDMKMDGKTESVEMMKDDHMKVDMMKADTMAADAMMSDRAMKTTLASGEFTRRNKTLKGNYKVVEENGQTIIRFEDNFKASRGPDLKVFLSPQTIETAKGSNATNGALLLGFVKSSKGTQDYVLPAGVNIANFNSVLIHCEQFSVLWGGGNI